MCPPFDGSGATCTTLANTISADHSWDVALSCTLTTGTRNQTWNMSFDQSSLTQLSGSGTIQASLDGATCRSTYNMTWTQF